MHKILVVDEFPPLANLLALLLKRRGYLVDVALTKQDASTAIRSGPPDLLILDMVVPGTFNVGVLDVIAESPEIKSIPVILMSTMVEEWFAAVYQHPKMNLTFLEKPFRADTLQAMVSEQLSLI